MNELKPYADFLSLKTIYRLILIAILFLSSGIMHFVKGNESFCLQSDTLKSLYKNEQCGLNYFTKSAIIGKRMEFYGLPFPAQEQPVNLNISEFTSSSKVLKSYLWWVQSGIDTIGKINILTPDSVFNVLKGSKIGEVATNCWGNPGAAYRLDVSGLFVKNGNYKISGLLTDTTFNLTDVDGFSLMVIYEDTLKNYTAGINVYDGFVVSKFNTFEQSIYNFYSSNQIVEGKSFMLTSDFQNEPGTKIKLNSSSFSGFTQNFWDFYETPSYFIPGKTKIDFGIQSPNDCGNIVSFGSYIKTSNVNYVPVISTNADTLFSSNADNYQWLLNGSIIDSANNNFYYSAINGNYQVLTGNDTNNCYGLSSVYNFKTCNDRHKPNVYIDPPGIATDSILGTINWYSIDGLIVSSNNSSYTPNVSSEYYLSSLNNTDNCLTYSDTIVFKICKDFMKPNIKWQNNLLKTDSILYSLQWYLNGNPIANANNSSYPPTTNGVYWVTSFNPDYNCSVQSDSFVINFIGFDEYMIEAQLELINNPIPADKVLKINSSYSNEKFKVHIYTSTGSLVFSDLVQLKKGINEIKLNDINELQIGLYFMEFVNEGNTMKKSIKFLID